MTLPLSIIRTKRAAAICAFALILWSSVAAQRVAMLAPDKSEASHAFAVKLKEKIDQKLAVVDDSIGEAAFEAARIEKPFNMTTEVSKAVGTSVGCDFFILVRSETLRRSSSKQNEYYEAYAAIYAVSSRTGKLVLWRLPRYEAAKPQEAERLLNADVGSVALEIVEKLKSTMKGEMAEPHIAQMEEPPDENSPAAKNFRAPIPYRRLKPDYTIDAFLYGVEATVEIMVDVDATGRILRTEIVHWAGYGLDESVDRTVRAMNWRPAERNGKPLPMRFLLRYNFRKLEKE